ncbi:YtxH domain-containing protein [Salicibibacter cibarius]|uniref:YtxH domain-containing protein n=1 Tax=Salicibibacter cibarius TaxID=2743000 RepID=A0A7T6Z3S4_9BACI|nr:YtxH domain-containing protein [Salicibibacter cibarius]QQK76253.1 YtxH domain-containing protein [Salicibibacter cibarius]
MNTKDVLIGMGIGVAVGVTTTLLSTPKSGKELRNDIGEKSTRAKEKTSTFANIVTEQSSQVKSQMQHAASQLKNELKKNSVPPLNDTETNEGQKQKKAE